MNFTHAVEELQSQGIQMSIQGSQFLVKGTLVHAICDVPTSGALGGYKESAQAPRPCRDVMEIKPVLEKSFYLVLSS